jgi:hypothetical protein
MSKQGQMGKWDGYVAGHLLPRIFGFELLMAPYVIAHLKLGLQLKNIGYTFQSKERLGVYLTNTLEEAVKSSEMLMAQYIVKEANTAAEIKKEKIIKKTHSFVDRFKVGTLNYHPHSKTINWHKFANDVCDVLASLQCDYYLKDDLKKWL